MGTPNQKVNISFVPRDITEVLRGVGGSEFPWKDPTLGTLLRRAADEIERLRAELEWWERTNG